QAVLPLVVIGPGFVDGIKLVGSKPEFGGFKNPDVLYGQRVHLEVGLGVADAGLAPQRTHGVRQRARLVAQFQPREADFRHVVLQLGIKAPPPATPRPSPEESTHQANRRRPVGSRTTGAWSN